MLFRSPPPREEPTNPGAIQFGCFNNFTKVTDQILAQWGQLLDETPGARLLIKSPYLDRPAVAERIRGRLRLAGLDPARVELLGHVPSAQEHMNLYRRIDVALDTTPYNGTTTTCEALWMGVPVVTLRGDRHAARVGASLLTVVGCGDWVVDGWAAYRQLARTLATGEGGSARRGAALRERMRSSLLMDSATQAERFWTTLRAQYASE